MRLLLIFIMLFPLMAFAEMVDFQSNGFFDHIKFPNTYYGPTTSIYAKTLYDSMIRVEPTHNGQKVIKLKKSGVQINCNNGDFLDMGRYSCSLYLVRASHTTQDEFDGIILTSLTQEDSHDLYHALKRPDEFKSHDVGYYTYMINARGVQKLIKVFNNGPLEIFCSKVFGEFPSCRISFDKDKNF